MNVAEYAFVGGLAVLIGCALIWAIMLACQLTAAAYSELRDGNFFMAFSLLLGAAGMFSGVAIVAGGYAIIASRIGGAP